MCEVRCRFGPRQFCRVGVRFARFPRAKYTCPTQHGQEGDEICKGVGPVSNQEGEAGASEEGPALLGIVPVPPHWPLPVWRPLPPAIPCVGSNQWQHMNIRRKRSKGGKTVIEWPRGCLYCRFREVKPFLEKHGSTKHSFHGCMYGLVSVRPMFKGQPIKQPWAIATNARELKEHFNKQLHHGPNEHCECSGADTHVSENYTAEIACAIHLAWEKHCKQ